MVYLHILKNDLLCKLRTTPKIRSNLSKKKNSKDQINANVYTLG